MMEWLNEILGDIENAETIKRLVGEKIKERYIPLIDYEVLKHENNILENINNDYKNQLESDEYFTKFNELNERFNAETERLNKIIDDNLKAYLIEKAIINAGGRNTKAICALLDMDKVTVDENGELSGLELERIIESDPYVFEKKEKRVMGTGNRITAAPIRKTDAFVASARKAAGLID